ANTTLKDNPRLNVREWQGKDPLRLVIDRHLDVDNHLEMIHDAKPTVIFTDHNSSTSKAEMLSCSSVEIVRLDFDKRVLGQILEHLYKRNVLSLFVEGGEQTISGFFSEGLWDEARVFIGNKAFHSGVKAPDFPDRPIYELEELLESRLYIFRNRD
ncbi:MAG: RibD family protein, partial [Bacteroidota bacterium]